MKRKIDKWKVYQQHGIIVAHKKDKAMQLFSQPPYYLKKHNNDNSDEQEV